MLLHVGIEAAHGQTQQDAITNLGSMTQLGRPDFNVLFEEMAVRHPGTDIGIFFCGPPALGASIRKCQLERKRRKRRKRKKEKEVKER